MRNTIAPILLALAGNATAAALTVQISVGAIEHPQLPVPLRDVDLRCTLLSTRTELACLDGTARVHIQGQEIGAQVSGRLHRNGAWQAAASVRARGLTLADASGRYASEKLDLDLDLNLEQVASPGSGDSVLQGEVKGRLPRGQLYVEPVFVDFANAPASLDAGFRYDGATRGLEIEARHFEHAGVFRGSAHVRIPADSAVDATLHLDPLQLGPAFPTYAQPFLAGSPLEKLTLDGAASGTLVVQAGVLRRVALQLQQVSLESQAFVAGLHGLNGAVHWSDKSGTEPTAEPTILRWAGGHLAKLELGPADLRFRSTARNVELLAPLRLPLAGGALRVRELSVQDAGRPEMSARFDAEIEPIDLAALCRAFGWPEFTGSLGGRLPGLSLKDRELKLDGALTAHAFDGSIAVDGLSVLDPFGRVPRVQGNVRLRNLDLAALTGAFSFGRIEGRLDGDVRNLRLLDWLPVAFQARLQTTPGDRSRHRISQRAIDNLSSIGGGPSGVLSRGALSVFKNFAYERIGWSCVLADGVCHMDGVEPAKNGGYVLVKGRWLPRIDVVGFNRTVDWTTFVDQLQNVRHSGGAQVR